MKGFHAILVLSAAAAPSAFAAELQHPQGIDVALMGAVGGYDMENDVADKLLATGLINSVTIFNIRCCAPKLWHIVEYDAVLTWSGAWYGDPEETGDVLADFVDQGGGVVVMCSATADEYRDTLEGRWSAEGYEVIMPNAPKFYWYREVMGEIYEPNHPILEGVSSLDSGAWGLVSTSTTLSPAGKRIADWADGKFLAATDGSHRTQRVDLNFFPVSDDLWGGGWVESTDGARLMANALVWSTLPGTPDLEVLQPTDDYLTFYLQNLIPESSLVILISSRGAGPTSTTFGSDVSVTYPWFQTPAFSVPPRGRFSLTITLPSGAAGSTLYCQSLQLDSNGDVALSNPVAFVVPTSG